jgi:hypothetical protein
MIGGDQAQQVAYAGGQHVLLAFKVIALPGEAPQGAGNIQSYRGFLGNNERFIHEFPITAFQQR